MRRIGNTLALMLVAILISAVMPVSLPADAVPMISKEELKPLLGDPDLVLLDVRMGKDWKASEFKIKGAWIDYLNESIEYGAKRSMDGIFSHGIIERYGQRCSFTELITIFPKNEASIVSELRKEGYLCIRDDSLVNTACGIF